jgi:polar amino acid transport system substrate-binding protein
MTAAVFASSNGGLPMLLRLARSLRLLLPAAMLFAAHASGLTLLTEENPPFNFTEKGKLVGSGAEVVAEMIRRANLSATTEILPWDTAYVRAQAAKETCLFSTARLDNRERLFIWVGPIATNVWAIYGRSDFAAPVKSLADLKRFRIGGVVSDAKAEYLRENLLTNVRALPEDRMNPPRLLLPDDHPDHIDLWIAGLYGAREIAKASNVTNLKLVLVVREVPLYLACSPRTRPETIQALNAALESVRADGTLQRITGAYERRFAQ